MIDDSTAQRILSVAQGHWSEHVQSTAFKQIAQGKEIGHRIADFVDENTTALLAKHFQTRHQRDGDGNARSRSMGDIWLHSSGIFNPINVKAGVVGREGQPNLVSIKKLLDALLDCRIDSYYLLIVKVAIDASPKAQVFLVDLLDYLEFVAFDSGPGQLMMRAKSFFDACADGYVPPKLSVPEKVTKLFAILEDGERRLAENRAKSLTSLRSRFKGYKDRRDFHVSPANQNPLNLQ